MTSSATPHEGDHEDDRASGVAVRDVDPGEALAFLAALEAASGVPPVDEDERRRLAGEPPVRDPAWDWAGHLVVLDGRPRGYAGVRTPPAGTDGASRVDLAIDRSDPAAHVALGAALDHLRAHAVAAGTSGVEAWLRGASEDELAAAAAVGFRERTRLHVLGADAAALRDAVPARPEVPDDVELRAYDPADPTDADAVVRLLTRAYPELADTYRDRFPVLTRADWFRPDDLLLARADGALVALHWMKRRGDGVGEVYNLAVDPDAQGRALGPLLLDTGIAHLLDVGCDDVILWVRSDNARAVALYRSRGFTSRWDDVSLVG